MSSVMALLTDEKKEELLSALLKTEVSCEVDDDDADGDGTRYFYVLVSNAVSNWYVVGKCGFIKLDGDRLRLDGMPGETGAYIVRCFDGRYCIQENCSDHVLSAADASGLLDEMNKFADGSEKKAIEQFRKL